MWGKSHCFECPTDKYIQILPCKKKRKARLLQYIKNPLPSKNEGPLFTTIVSPNCSHCTYLAHPTKPLAESRLGVGSSHREYNHCISLWHILTHQMSKSETWKTKTIKKQQQMADIQPSSNSPYILPSSCTAPMAPAKSSRVALTALFGRKEIRQVPEARASPLKVPCLK